MNIHLKIRHGLIALCCPLVLGAVPASFAQQAYPTRPVTLTVGFAPGGSTDRLARLLALGMQEELGQQVIVENRPGAAGNIAAQLVAQAAPNGYTLFMSTLSSQAINSWIYSKLGFDPIKSFEPVALVARYPLVMAVTPSLALKTPKEVLDHIRQNPGKMYFSSAGAGSPGHLSGELLQGAAKLSMVHVPYKGGSPAMVAAISGEVPLTIETIPAMIPHVKSGKLIGVAVTSSKRSSALPDLPTLAEAGLPGFEVTSWAGILAPANTPPDVIAKLQGATAKAMESPRIKAALDSDGAEASFLPGPQFKRYMEDELKRWGEVVKNAKVKID